MRVTAYLYVSKTQNVRLTKTAQTPRANEIRVEVRMEIPDAYFVRPTPVVSLTIPASDESVPVAEVIASTAKTVAQALSVEVEDVRDGLEVALERARRKDHESEGGDQ